MFDSKIGVIAAGGMAFMWSFLFWSVRFQPDFWSLNFQLLAILFYWKVFKHGRTKYAALAGVCAAAAFYFKISALLVPFSIFIFIFLKERFSFIKNKNHWVALGSYLLALVPFMVWQFITFGNPLAFAPSYALPEYRAGRSLGWMALQFFYSFSGIGFFVLFIIGVGIFLFYLAMTSDLYLKGKYKEASPELLSFIVLLVNAAFYIFFIKGIIEDRWIFLIAPFVFFFSAKGMMVLYNYLYKIRKGLALFFVLAMFALFIYGQIAHSYPLLINKKSTYLPVKESSLWIKDHTSPGDSFLSISYTQATSYSERKVITYSTFNASVLDEVIAKDKPKYLMVSVFEPHPSWISPWIESNSARLTIAQAYFADPSQKQPLLIVYEIKK
jgi:4-amino-4-deoxy-L-arabinose transferase-like glycosyltransferase